MKKKRYDGTLLLVYSVGSTDEKVEEFVTWKVSAAKSLQSCPTLWDPIDGSPPGEKFLGGKKPLPLNIPAKTYLWGGMVVVV